MGYVSTRRGFGALSTTIESSVGQGLLTAAPSTGPLAPFVALAGAISDLLASIGIGAGCGQTCIAASNFANEAAALLDQNIHAYFAIPASRPQSAQTAALANFETVWNALIAPQACGNPQLGSAGQKCISDREAGACTWKQTADTVPAWGTPPVDACWNWDSGYRAPIADDPNVVPDALASTASGSPGVTTSSSSIVSSIGASSSAPWLLLAAAAVLVWAVT